MPQPQKNKSSKKQSNLHIEDIPEDSKGHSDNLKSGMFEHVSEVCVLIVSIVHGVS
jgi:hypothetical protein